MSKHNRERREKRAAAKKAAGIKNAEPGTRLKLIQKQYPHPPRYRYLDSQPQPNQPVCYEFQ